VLNISFLSRIAQLCFSVIAISQSCQGRQNWTIILSSYSDLLVVVSWFCSLCGIFHLLVVCTAWIK